MILSGEICIGKLLAVVAGIYLLVVALELLTIQHSRQGVAFLCIRLQCNVRNKRIKCDQMGKVKLLSIVKASLIKIRQTLYSSSEYFI